MKDSPPFYSFTGKKYYMPLKDSPGPGSYSPTDSYLSNSPRYKVGTSQRKPWTAENLTPGPGSYTHDLSATSPAWTLAGKTGRDGAYSREGAFRSYRTPLYPSSPCSSQMKSKRRTASAVGDYHGFTPESSPKRGANLFEPIRKNSVPGPGVYEVKSKKEGPSYTMRPRFQIKIKNPVPGPGQYMPKNNLTFEKSPAWLTGKEGKVFNKLNKDHVDNPGPGTYEKTSTLSGPQWTFGGDKKVTGNFTKVPGPGSYTTQIVFANPPSYVNFRK